MKRESANIHKEIFWLFRYWAAIIYVLQSLFPRSKRLESWRLQNVTAITRSLRRSLGRKNLKAGQVVEVDRRVNLSETEFVEQYLNKHLPVVFENQANDWPCVQKWNLDFLDTKLGNVKIEMFESAGLIERDLDQTGGKTEPVMVEETTGHDLSKSILSGENKYLRFSSLMESQTHLIEDLDHNWLKKMRKCLFGVGYQTFIGAAKRVTPIHAGSTAFFYVMADGEKRWTLFSASSSALMNPIPSGRVYNFTDVNIHQPDLEKYPGFELLSRFTCHLKKGDILFVPTWMWHEVENLTHSWGMSYRITSLRGFLRYPAYVFVRVLLAKPNFFKLLWSSVFGRPTTKAETSLITPQMFKN